MDLTALVDNLAPAIQVCFVRGVLDCLPFCESEIGASGLCCLPVCLTRRIQVAFRWFCFYGNDELSG